jgi:hypothetical protein
LLLRIENIGTRPLMGRLFMTRLPMSKRGASDPAAVLLQDYYGDLIWLARGRVKNTFLD